MLITRIGLGTLALALACATPARSQASCTIVLYGEWRLQFSSGEIVHDATLTMSGCTGNMRVSFYNVDTRQRETITQRMTLSQSAQGMRISGSYPVYYYGTTRRHPDYVVDRLVYSVDPEGRATFRNCDVLGNCSPVEVLSETRAMRILLQNACTREIDVAIFYQTPQRRWMRRGWWVLAPGAIRETDASTLNRNVYFYAQGGTMAWHGEGELGSEIRTVVDEAFETDGTVALQGLGLRTVSFFRTIVDPTRPAHTQRFSCPAR